MNLKNILSALVFIFAIGSAVASESLVDRPGFSRQADVPLQAEHCIERANCPGGTVDCTISFSIGATQYNNIPLYSGSPQSETTCGVKLKMNP